MQRLIISALLICLALSTMAGVKAEPLYALSSGFLIGFDSTSPGTLTSSVPITGVSGALRTFDFRPSLGANNGVLYGLAEETVVTPTGSRSAYRLYTINPQTGVATRGDALIDAATGERVFVTSSFLGIDFNPTTDRLHLVNQGGENWRVNVDTGIAERGNRINTSIAGAAFTNNFAGASLTQLYAIDASRFPDSLGVIHLDTGTFNQVGPLGVFTTPDFGFDVSGLTGMAYASLADATQPAFLHTINLATGQATRVGLIGSGFLNVAGLAAPIGAPVGGSPVPEPATMLLLCTGFAGVGAVVRRRRNLRR